MIPDQQPLGMRGEPLLDGFHELRRGGVAPSWQLEHASDVAEAGVHRLRGLSIDPQAGRQALGMYPTLPHYRKMFMAAGFTEQDMHPVSERLIESLVVWGLESKIRDRVLELLATNIDALALSLVPVSDISQERGRLARLVGQL